MLRTPFALFLLPLIFLSCSRQEFSFSGNLLCAEELHAIEMTVTHVESERVYEIPVSADGAYSYTDMPVGEYQILITAKDSSQSYMIHRTERYFNLPSSDVQHLVSYRIDWLEERLELMDDGYHLFLDRPNAICNWPASVRLYVSKEDPDSFEDPNDLYSEDYLVYDEPMQSQEIDLRFEQSGMYYGIEWRTGDSWTRQVPEYFTVGETPTHQLRQGDFLDFVVLDDTPVWIKAIVPEGRLSVLEYFDINSKEVSGRDLLMSAYSLDGSITYFERRPLQPDDGAPVALWLAEGEEDVLLKAEVDDDGNSGRFQMFSSYTNDEPVSGIEPIVRLDDFFGTYKSYQQNVSPGTHTLSSFERNPSARAIRYWLFNTTTGEIILNDLAPSTDSTAATEHPFTVDEWSDVRLVVTKSYWGDFDNVVKFSFD